MPASSPQGDTLEDTRRGADPGSIALQPQLFLVIESERPLAGSARCSLLGVDEVRFVRASGGRSFERGAPAVSPRTLSIGVPDRRMSALHARLTRDRGALVLTDCGSTNGTRVNGDLIASRELADGDLVEIGRTFFRFRAAVPTPEDTAPDVDWADLASTTRGLRTLAPSLAAQFSAIVRVARSSVPIVVSGPTGTGKELVARALHELSGRAGPFVAINCGALPEGLLESQLFGHVRGAFSGAIRNESGYVRDADGGTLFLDEIADLAPASQAALLRVLQEKEVTPVGATRPIPVDLRAVCATHADLDARAAEGRFRLDLLARVAGMRVALPPLSERIDELGGLISEIMGGLERAPRAFEAETIRALARYDWPMNVRELAQCLGLAAALADTGAIATAHLPPSVRTGRSSLPPAGSRSSESARAEPIEDAALRAALVTALEESGGNVSAAARTMGKARMQIQRWIKRFGLDPLAFKK
jgi:sigma-54 dependent transcriptional regulator, acetoin dehydrogenase operon transcriptional activator AcoR